VGYKIEADFEHLEKDELVGLGPGIAVKNGGSVEVDDETAAIFKEQIGKTITEYFADSDNVKTSTTSTKKGGGDD
jgi:hypothetical protein